MADGGLRLNFGWVWALLSSGMLGGGKGRGEVAWDARKRAAAARGDRRDELCSVRLAVLRGRRREERDGTGSFEASAWLRAALNAEVGRDCRRVHALAGDHSGGMGVGRTVSSRRSTVYSFE